MEFTLTTPQGRVVVDFYRLIGTDLQKLERIPSEQAPLRRFVRYATPATAPESVLLAHVSTLGDTEPDGAEYVCMARIPHTGNRHAVALACDLPSTVSFYLYGSLSIWQPCGSGSRGPRRSSMSPIASIAGKCSTPPATTT